MSDKFDSEETVDELLKEDFVDLFFAAPGLESMAMAFGAASHTGLVRSTNEDHFVVFQRYRVAAPILSSLEHDDLPRRESTSYSLVVADGMGGMKSGELASRTVLQAMLALVGQATSWVMKLTDADAQQIQDRVDAYVSRIQDALQRSAGSSAEASMMGTTCTSAHVLGDRAVIVHLGDSRAYLLRGGLMTQLTHDDTVAQSMIDTGVEPSRVKRFRHILINGFGGGANDPIASIRVVSLRPADKLLLCSDGLTDLVPDEQITATLEGSPTPQEACDRLVQQALDRGGVDNVTVVLGVTHDANGAGPREQ